METSLMTYFGSEAAPLPFCWILHTVVIAECVSMHDALQWITALALLVKQLFAYLQHPVIIGKARD